MSCFSCSDNNQYQRHYLSKLHLISRLCVFQSLRFFPFFLTSSLRFSAPKVSRRQKSLLVILNGIFQGLVQKQRIRFPRMCKKLLKKEDIVINSAQQTKMINCNTRRMEDAVGHLEALGILENVSQSEYKFYPVPTNAKECKYIQWENGFTHRTINRIQAATDLVTKQKICQAYEQKLREEHMKTWGSDLPEWIPMSLQDHKRFEVYAEAMGMANVVKLDYEEWERLKKNDTMMYQTVQDQKQSINNSTTVLGQSTEVKKKGMKFKAKSKTNNTKCSLR